MSGGTFWPEQPVLGRLPANIWTDAGILRLATTHSSCPNQNNFSLLHSNPFFNLPPPPKPSPYARFPTLDTPSRRVASSRLGYSTSTLSSSISTIRASLLATSFQHSPSHSPHVLVLPLPPGQPFHHDCLGPDHFVYSSLYRSRQGHQILLCIP